MKVVENSTSSRNYTNDPVYLFRDTKTNRFEYSPPLTPTMKELTKGLRRHLSPRPCLSPMPSQPKPQPQSFSYVHLSPSDSQVAVEQQRCKVPVPCSTWVKVKEFGNFEATPIYTAKLLYYPKIGGQYLSRSKTSMLIAQSKHPQISATSASDSSMNILDKSPQPIISPINVEFSGE